MSTPIQDKSSGWSSVWLVASREITTRLKSKAWRISTVVLMLLIVAGALVMKLVSGGSDATVGVLPQSASLSAPLQASATSIGQTVTVNPIADEAAGRAKVADGSLDALLLDDPKAPGKVSVVVKKDLDGKLKNALNVLAGQVAFNDQVQKLGGDPAAVNKAVAGAAVNIEPMETPTEYSGQQIAIGFIAGLLIYLSLMLNGQMVAQGVVEEKTSRVVELLLSTVRPWQLMTGKVLGIGAVGLLQMVLIGVAGLAAALGTNALSEVSISATVGAVVWLVVWFLLGFLMYAIVFAALGALVSRQEDVGGAVTPALMFVVAGYIIGVTIVPSNPGSKLVEVLSVIPVFSPTLMPVRLAIGGVPVWETALSVVLTLAALPVLIWLAGRIYRNAVMRTGAKVKLRDALTAA
ncbi:ABC transporter permease [Amycolatopsis sp. CA-230715]|uniref:ABC transporter permease n=1 Tax=Amycolatopsis sp. CA-230715 TaxID=2745196 RepID=UPI001C011E90|nr:ABC transporter permease [Amycolatopsis sp. CA-230715]QWF83098.1 putative protein YhaP [Amycolatopsis sp. CA-230715]